MFSAVSAHIASLRGFFSQPSNRYRKPIGTALLVIAGLGCILYLKKSMGCSSLSCTALQASSSPLSGSPAKQGSQAISWREEMRGYWIRWFPTHLSKPVDSGKSIIIDTTTPWRGK